MRRFAGNGRSFSTAFSTTKTAIFGQKLPSDWAEHGIKKHLQTADTNGLQVFLRGTPEGTRTPNIQNRNLTLYPIELRAHLIVLT